MQATGQVPDDFVAYVATHGGWLRLACHTLTGNHKLATGLQRDLLAAIALRWWLLRRRSAARAATHLERLVRREARNWLDTTPIVALAPAVVAADDPASVRRLAADAWDRAGHVRMHRRVAAMVAAVACACLATIGPTTPRLSQPFPPIPGPTAIPDGVLVLPAFADLARLPARTTRLPGRIDVSPDAAEPLRDQPVARAVAVARHELGTMLVVAEDGTTRQVDDAALAGARLLTTSLSPDGERVAMVASTGLLVVDVGTGEVRSVGDAAMRPGSQALSWRTARTVLVPAVDGAREVNVDTGATAVVPGISGLDVVSTQGAAPMGFTELVGAGAGLPARIRVWRTAPSSTAGAGASAGVAPGGDVEDRRVSGPPWLGVWMGAGWSAGDTFVRACLARSLDLPESVGSARGAIAAIDADGTHAGTLTVVDFTTLEILGFADSQTVLVSAGSAQRATTILAWNPRAATLRRVTALNGYVRVSLPDLLSAP